MQQENSEVVDTSSHGTTAAMASIPAFLNGAIGVTVPDSSCWVDATKSDAETALLLSMTVNPAKLTKENINKVHAVYRQPLRSGLVYSDAGLVYIRETFPDSDKFVRLVVAAKPCLRGVPYEPYCCAFERLSHVCANASAIFLAQHVQVLPSANQSMP